MSRETGVFGAGTRRNWLRSVTFGLGAAALPQILQGQPQNRKLKIGYSTLCWNVNPKMPEKFEEALRDIKDLGFWGFETVSPILEATDKDNTLAGLIEKYGVPFKAVYLSVNVTDTAQRKEMVARAIDVGKKAKKYKATYVVIAVNGRGGRNSNFNFAEHKQNIVSGLNEIGAAITDLGLGTGLHQHTNTVVETRDEVYATMEAVNTKVMKFAPDVGQLQKGGADAAKVVKDFAGITDHMHVKDYSNGKYMGGYCPLGMGVVDLASIFDTMENNGLNADMMVELDRPIDTPMSARATAEFSKHHLMRLGYQFKV